MGAAIGDEAMVLLALSNVGTILYCLERFRESIEIHQKALSLAIKVADIRAEMRSFANLGNCFGAMGKFEEARVLHDRQHELAVSLGDKDAARRAAFNLENDFNSMKKYKDAKPFRDIKRNTGDTDKVQILNDGFGDTMGRELHSGWLVKHTGGSLEGPRTYNTERKWCVLTKNVFAYHKNIQTGRRADRYIKVGDITKVNICVEYEMPDGKNKPIGLPTLRLCTKNRASDTTS